MSYPSASTSQQDDDVVITRRAPPPEWVERLLGQDMSGDCPSHSSPSIATNRFCITCNDVSCNHCVVSRQRHQGHTVLTVYKHVYCNVIPVAEIRKLIDCSPIQIYKCNGKRVVSLVPLPHSGSGTGGDGACCLICKRKLAPQLGKFSVCSITCKLELDIVERGDGIEMLLCAARTVEARQRALTIRNNY